MIQPTLFRIPGNFSLILLCVVLGACASTQRSGTGSGEQAAAPIADASTPQGGAKPGDATGSSSAGTSGNSSSSPAKPAGATAAAGGTAAKQGSAESSAATADNEEAAQLKRQLADQDAQINKLRADQEAEAAREEAQAAKMREQQAAAAGGSDQQAADGAASAAKSGNPDEAAVFPANASTADAGSVESAVQRAAERSVYFNYDQATVPEKYDDMLLANAAWLKAHPDVKSEVQGNCDERGSREYNLALGARRAMAVKRALELAGADGSRISAISYGAEKPVATGKDEGSYSQNRRADIVY